MNIQELFFLLKEEKLNIMEVLNQRELLNGL